MNKSLIPIIKRIEKIKKKLTSLKELVNKAEQKKLDKKEKLELTT